MIHTRTLLIVLLSIHIQATAMQPPQPPKQPSGLLGSFFNLFDGLATDTPEPEPKDPLSDFLLPGKSREYKNELWRLCSQCSADNEEQVTQKVAALIKTGSCNVNERNNDYKNENLLHITGPTTKLTQLLVDSGADINAQDLEGNTPLHNACKFCYKAAISIFLKHPTTNVNIKNNDGSCPIFCIFESSFKSSEEQCAIANLLLDSNKIDLDKKNKYKETFFCKWIATWTDEGYDNLPLNFISRLTEPERQKFTSQELLCAAAICKDKDVRDIIKRCLKLGADINHRNYKGQRPLEIAAERYTYATKCLVSTDKPLETKKDIYYRFLQNTPYVYDQEIRSRLAHNGLIADPIKRIMGFYTALITMDRACALYPQVIDPFPPRNLKKDKRELLDKICNNLGYANPMIKN